jgi:integrase
VDNSLQHVRIAAARCRPHQEPQRAIGARASIAISSGVNVLALSRMLGHTSAKVTLDTYADLFDTDLDAVASALDLKCAHSVPKARPIGTVGA